VFTIRTTWKIFTNTTLCSHSGICILYGSGYKEGLFPYTTTNLFSQQRFYTLKFSCQYMYHQFCIQQFYVLPTHYIFVLCGSKNKQLLFPYITLIDGFYKRDLTLYSQVVTIRTISLTCNNATFCSHSEFMCFIWIWVQTAIISEYSMKYLVYNLDLLLYSPVVTICTTSLTIANSTSCQHTVFMCFVWTWEKPVVISLYSINWLLLITEMNRVYCAVRTECNVKTEQSYWYTLLHDMELILTQFCEHRATSSNLTPHILLSLLFLLYFTLP